ncbi:MAG: hypothetical protein EOO41_03355 [Methanobacteriota archaeon]|nr:MAG: hypothetical protein EOO41_03355 [Euryarchaeota archaeon]
MTVTNILASLYKNSFLAAAASVFGVFIQQQCSQGVKADKSLRATLGFVLLAASEKYVCACAPHRTPRTHGTPVRLRARACPPLGSLCRLLPLLCNCVGTQSLAIWSGLWLLYASTQ